MSLSSAPTPEEVAAIVAAIEVAWPRPVVADDKAAVPAWRFSGRSWASRSPVAAQRRRP